MANYTFKFDHWCIVGDNRPAADRQHYQPGQDEPNAHTSRQAQALPQ